MRSSESIKTIAPALLKAQKEIGAAKKGAENPFFSSRYADLGSIMEVCKKPLNDNGIAVLQPVGLDDNGRQYVETVLLHESGEFVADRMMLDIPQKLIRPSKNSSEIFEPYLAPDPQVQGSAISYARRYSLQSMLFIPAEDDDGEKATTHSQPSPQGTKKTTPEATTILVCDVCKSRMVHKSGTKDGKNWSGWFCPNSTQENRHPTIWDKQ